MPQRGGAPERALRHACTNQGASEENKAGQIISSPAGQGRNSSRMTFEWLDGRTIGPSHRLISSIERVSSREHWKSLAVDTGRARYVYTSLGIVDQPLGQGFFFFACPNRDGRETSQERTGKLRWIRVLIPSTSNLLPRAPARSKEATDSLDFTGR
jgi:hypothetical protein